MEPPTRPKQSSFALAFEALQLCIAEAGTDKVSVWAWRDAVRYPDGRTRFLFGDHATFDAGSDEQGYRQARRAAARAHEGAGGREGEGRCYRAGTTSRGRQRESSGRGLTQNVSGSLRDLHPPRGIRSAAVF
jgi:hypothetical protein